MNHVIEQIHRMAMAYPLQLALIQEEITYTYADMIYISKRIAMQLVNDLNIKPLDRIAIHVSNNPDLVILMLAVFQARATVILVDKNLPLGRKKLMIEMSQANLIISTEYEKINEVSVSNFFFNMNDIISKKMSIREESLAHLSVEDPAYVFFTS